MACGHHATWCARNSISVSHKGPVFIVGMPRSGTTLLRSLFNAHPSLAIAGETHLLDRWMARHRKTDLSTSDGFAAFWADYTATADFGVLSLDATEVAARIQAAGPPSFQRVFTGVLEAYAEAQGKPRSGEKTPGHYRHLDLLLGWFPSARVLFLQRDPRAVAASWKALDRPWTDQPLEVIVVRWRRSIEIAERWSSDGRVRLVPYEQLVRTPEAVVAHLCEWLDEPFVRQILDEDRGRPPGWRASKASGPVSVDSVERWQEQLSPDEIAIVEYLGRSAMARLGYERSGPALPRHRQVTLEAAALARRVRGATAGAMSRFR